MLTSSRLFGAFGRKSALVRNLCMDVPASSFHPRSSSSLSSLLQRELAEERGNCDVSEDLADLQAKVLSRLQLSDAPNRMQVLLTGKYGQDEEIKVSFNCEDQVENDEEDEEFDEDYEELNKTEHGQEEEEEEEEEDDDVLPDIEFSVEISKAEQTLLFDCIASDVLTIERIAHIYNEEGENDDDYSGPLFDEFEQDVQEGFYKYLAERHIDDDLASFITQYADLKEQKEYVSFLDKTTKFIQ